MDTTKQQANISEAIVSYVQTGWSQEAERQIEKRYGAEVARHVQDVYEQALGCRVDWHTATMDSALDILHDFLAREFPWLSSEARTRLNYCFIMAWK